MNLKNFMDGLSILSGYFTHPDGYHLGAEHDQIYVYATDRPLVPDDVQTMRDLGWFQPDMADGDEYSMHDGWSCFV